MTAYVFVFVPVYVERRSAIVVETPVWQVEPAEHQQIKEEHPPFWTWFIDNPRPVIQSNGKL